jgi:hypothetical protein
MDKHSRYMINSIAMPYVTLLCKKRLTLSIGLLSRLATTVTLIKKPKV